MSRKMYTVASAGLLLVWGSSIARAAEFHSVASPSGGFYLQFKKFELSSNGRVIAGSGREAFRWTADNGIEPLGFYNQLSATEYESSAYGLSADGSIVVGSSLVDRYHIINMPVEEIAGFKWEGGVFTMELPWLSGDDEAYPLDLSDDGVIAVGASYEVDTGPFWHTYWVNAVRWINDSPENLGTLWRTPIARDDDAYALAVSGDGSVVVGQSGEIFDYWRPFVWIGGTMEPLELLSAASCPGPQPVYHAYGSCNRVTDVSRDGQMAVGFLYDGANHKPVRWDTTTRQPMPLPLLLGDIEGWAWDVTRGATMIVGSSGGQGVVWTESSGYAPLPVDTLLQSLRLGSQIEGWDLHSVSEVSAGGKFIAGYGYDPSGSHRIWYADLRNPQPNDACAFAQWIGGGPVANTLPKTTLGSLRDTTNDGASTCSFPHGPDVWYAFSAPVDGYLYLDTCGTASQPDPVEDLVVSVHEGTCPGGSSNTIWCADECAGYPCAGELPCILPQHVPISAGQNYLVRVAKKADDMSEGTYFELKSRFLPDTDACDDAFVVDVPGPGEDPVMTLGLTSHATADTAPICLGVEQTAPGVWYKVIGTGRRIVVDTLEGTDFDTKLTVYCSGCGGHTCVGANNDHDPSVTGSSVSWCSQWGTVYHVLVHGNVSETGSFALRTWDAGSCTPSPSACAPPNDACEDALSISPGSPAAIIGDNTGSTTDGSATCEASNHDVWYSYTAECEGVVQIDTCQPEIGSLIETVLSVYDSCGGAELACNFDETAPCLGRATVTAPTAPGEELWIRVADAGTLQQDEGTFPLRIEEIPDALSLPTGTLPDSTQGQYYATTLPVSGGCPPYIVEAALPAGLRFRYAGIYGTPETSGVFTIPMTVHDQGGSAPAQSTMTLRVLSTNDDCAQSIPITEGGTHFGNPDATTDGPDEPFGCNFSGYSHVESDIWFCYTSSCEGRANISLCDSTFDTKVAVYSSCRCGVGLGDLLACNDDSCNVQSEVSFEVREGWEYAVRIGGYNGAQGDGQLTITCVNKPACCLPDGGCEDRWSDDCEAQGGVVQDPRASCGNVVCPPGPEACCLRDGSCQDLSADNCWDQFGFPQGDGTTCTTMICAQPQACCLDDGSCGDLPAEECSGWSGSAQGAGTTCATVTCPGPAEACCFSDGSCQDLTLDDCSVLGGVSLGPGTICAESYCPVLEACCLDDGSCQELDTAGCAALAGESQGAGTRCATTSCPQPPVGCCLPDDSCDDLPPGECTAQNGRPQYGRLCTAVDCTVLTGACCFQDGSCRDLMQQDCLGDGGIYFTPDTSCMDVACAQPEACCLSDATCEDLTFSYCLRRRGESGGPGSACGDDCNGDLLPDACQVFGDANLNGTVDLNDWPQMVGCMSGPGVPVSGQPCRVCILDCDNDVDLLDIAAFQRTFGE